MPGFSGTITALITPFRDGQVDFDALTAHVQRQIAAGVDGLVPCGTTGESPTLTPEEHLAVIQHVVKTAGRRVPVIAGTGSYSTAHALHLSRQAEEVGAEGLLIVSPYYNKPSQEGLFQHFATIARGVRLPIVLYNIPGRCGVEIAVDTIRRLRDNCDNIVSVKHATGKVETVADLLADCPIEVLSGDDPLTLPMMSVGAIGVISVLSNLAPRGVKRVTAAALAGDFLAAREANRKLHAIGTALLSLSTNPMPIKTACAMRGWCAEEFRLPMCPLPPEQRAKLAALLADTPVD